MSLPQTALQDVVLAAAAEHVVAAEAGDEVAQARAGDGVGRVGALHARQAGLDDDAQRRGAGQRHRAQPPVGERAHQRERGAAAVGVVDAHAVGRPARRPGAAARAEAAHVMARDVDERGGVAAVRGADGQRQPVGRGGHRPAHARRRGAAGASRACARPGARRTGAAAR